LVAAGTWLYFKLFPGDEQVIKNRLHEAADAVSIKPNTSGLSKLLLNEKLRGYFTSDVEIQASFGRRGSQTLSGRDELLAAIAAARSQIEEAYVHLPDLTVRVDPNGERATAYMTLLIDIDGEKNSVVQELKMILLKQEGDWLISRAETIDTLR
jgi:hypothetical protein